MKTTKIFYVLPKLWIATNKIGKKWYGSSTTKGPMKRIEIGATLQYKKNLWIDWCVDL